MSACQERTYEQSAEYTRGGWIIGPIKGGCICTANITLWGYNTEQV